MTPYGMGDNSTINSMPVIVFLVWTLPEVPKGEVYGGTSDAGARCRREEVVANLSR